VPMTVRAMKAGAFEFLTKPLGGDVLLDAVGRALVRSRTTMDHEAETEALRDCLASLSQRECQVMTLVVSGLLNKQVGAELGISEITVKAHRGNVMRKMKADSLVDLVHMAARLRLQTVAKARHSVRPFAAHRTRQDTDCDRGRSFVFQSSCSGTKGANSMF